MSDTIKQSLTADMKQAMRDKAKVKLGTIRMLQAAIKQHEIDNKTTLDDAGVLTIINKLCKMRGESITQFEKAGRDDLVAKEQEELEILKTYLPEQLAETEVVAIVTAAIQEVSASAMSDMGKVMAVLKPKLTGRADMAFVSKLVKDKLS